MPSLTVSRLLSAPPERVFALLTDLDGAPGRIRGIQRIERLDQGPVKVGTRWKETRVMFGREHAETLEVTALDAPRRMEVGCESCGVRYRSAFELAREGTGTRVTITIGGEPLTLAARLMAPMAGLMMGGLRKCLEDDLADLEKAAGA